MADPVQYETFGRMLFEHAPFLIAGAVSLVGGTILLLKKLGFASFNKEDLNKCETCKLKLQPVKCTAHGELHDTQVKMLAQQKINTQQLSNGKKEFRKLQDEITELKVGVGVLLDRSGGRPKEFKE